MIKDIKFKKFIKILNNILFYIIFIVYNIIWFIFLPLIFLFFSFNKYLNFKILKRFGIYKINKNTNKINNIIHKENTTNNNNNIKSNNSSNHNNNSNNNRLLYKCLIHGSSSGEVKIGYDLFGKNYIYTTFNKDGYEYLRKNKINSFPLTFDFMLFPLLFLKINNIKKIILVEQEIWPSLIIAAKLLKIKLYLINGIIYKKSLNSMKFFKFFYSFLFEKFDTIFIRDKKQFEMFSIFVNKNKLEIGGNLKLLIKKDELIPNIDIKKKLLSIFNKPVLIFASIHKQEFEKVSILIKELSSKYYFIVAPRKISESELFKKTLYKIENNIKINFFSNIKKYSVKNTAEINKNELNKTYKYLFKNNSVLILDKIGYLKYFYEVAYVSYIGGSYIDKGGQNFIESIIKFTPAIVGKYIYNFEDLFYIFKDKSVFYVEENKIIEFLSNPNNVENLFKKIPESINIVKDNINTISKIINKIKCE